MSVVVSETELETLSRPETSAIATSPKIKHSKWRRLFLGVLTWVCKVWIVCIYLACTAMDISTACGHYSDGNMGYFALTLSCVLLANLLANLISLQKYWIDKAPVSTIRKFIRFTFLIFLQSPLLRELDQFCYWLRKKQNRRNPIKRFENNELMLNEAAVASWLWLVIAFIQNAPQMILQIYIMATSASISTDSNSSYYTDISPTSLPMTTLLSNSTETKSNNLSETTTFTIQVAGLVLSLISMSSRVVLNQRAVRAKNELSHPQLSVTATMVAFVFNLLLIWSRVLPVGLFASNWPAVLALIIGCRCLVMTLAIVIIKLRMGGYSCISKYLYSFVSGLQNIFCFVNPVTGQTGWYMMAYYSWTCAENSTMIVLWYKTCPRDVWYKLPAMVTQFTCFLGGILVMILYYLLIHPKRKIKSRNRR